MAEFVIKLLISAALTLVVVFGGWLIVTNTDGAWD